MKKTTLLSLFVLASGLWIGGCSDDSSETPRSANIVKFRGTQSPGDVWEWEVNYDEKTLAASWDAGTFDNTDDDISIQGDFVILPSGYLKVTIKSSDPVSAEIPTDGSAFFYAMELPGTALIVKPEGSIKGDLIAMVAQGDCADVTGSYNYILTAPGSGGEYNALQEEAFGQVTMSGPSDAVVITGSNSSLDCLGGGPCTTSGPLNGIPVAICTGEGAVVIEDQGETKAQGQFTSGGVMMLDRGMGNGGVLALKTSSIVISDLNNKEFNGIGYFPTHDNDKTIPVTIQFDANGNAVGYAYTDIETGAVDSQEGASFTVENISNGLATGTINFTNGSSNFAASVLNSGGKQIMVLTSTTDELGNPPFILVMTSK